MSKIQRISSNATMLLKLFIPTFWLVFYGAITIALFVNTSTMVAFKDPAVRYGVLIFYISGTIVLYFTLMGLKRVEFNHEYLYISNYFRNSRIPWHNIKAVSEKKFLFIKIIVITFKESTSYGKRIYFIASKSLWRLFDKEVKSKIDSTPN